MSNELQQTQNTLWKLSDDLSAYFETREMLEAQLREPLEPGDQESIRAQVAEVEGQLARLGGELAAKTDNIAGVLRRMSTEQDALKAEQERIHDRRKTFERAEKWLRSYLLHTMQERGLKNLKTPSNTLFIRSSDAVVITEPEEVPEQYKTVTVKLPAVQWRNMVEQCEVSGWTVEAKIEETISLSAVKKDIKAGIEVAGADLEFHESLSLR